VLSVGVRQLKSRLSEYLRLVASGETVQVTDRGRVVAELRQPSPALPDSPLSQYPLLLAAAREGRVRLGALRVTAVDRPGISLPDGTAQRALDELRGD
jgi:antitoxin (DNA-binding transcriptional repressor) of toxin-antitoxin stability system